MLCYLSCYSNGSGFDCGESFQVGSCVPLIHLHTFFENYFLSGTITCFGLILYFLSPALESDICPRSPGSFDWEVAFSNQDLVIGVLTQNFLSIFYASGTVLGTGDSKSKGL